MKLLDKKEKLAYVNSQARRWREEGWAEHDILEQAKWMYNGFDYIECEYGGKKRHIKLIKTGIQNEFWYYKGQDNPVPEEDEARKEYFIAKNMKRVAGERIVNWKEILAEGSGEDVPEEERLVRPFFYVHGQEEAMRFGCTREQKRMFEKWPRSESYEVADEDIESYVEIVKQENDRFRAELESYWEDNSDKVRGVYLDYE